MADLANELAAAFIEEDVAEGDVAEAEAPEQVTEEAPEEFDFPSYQADTQGIEDLLEDEPEPEPEAVYTDPEDEEEEPVWDEDDATRRLKAENVKLQKRLAWEQEQRVKVQVKDWRAEAARRFPLADVEEINATSRRAFIKAAAAQHERTAKKLKPFTDAMEALKQQVTAEVKAEVREEAAEAWGRPTSAPIGTPVAPTNEAPKARISSRTPAHERVLALMKSGKIDI